MNTQELLDPKSWDERTFGGVQLHDMRRTRRAVKAATNLAENPLGSLPAQMHTWKEPKALYRWLDEPDVTFAALMQPHLHQTREQATSAPVVLLVQDTTDIDLSHRRKISGVGQIGNERGRGFFVQTVLAVRPQTREVLGCLAKATFCAHSRSRGRTTLSTAPTRGARNRCLDAPGAGHWHPGVGKQVGACRRSGGGYVPLLPGVSLDADALSGASRPESARARKRGRDHVCADAGPRLCEPGEPCAGASRSAWSSEAECTAPAGLWADDALATAPGATSGQGALDRVGHSCVGRGSSRRRGAAGMGLADLGPHHDARTSLGAGRVVSTAVAG